MFMVGGGILMHGLPGSHIVLHAVVESVRGIVAVGGILAVLAPTTVNALAGIIAGGLVLSAVILTKRIVSKLAK
jgi:predicted DNA repair protein MutK